MHPTSGAIVVTFLRLLGIAVVLAAIALGSALALFASSRSWGQEVTLFNVFWYHFLAGAFWSCLGLSLIYSLWGIIQQRWQPLALAAVLSGTVSIFAILSIGWLILIVTLGQIVVAVTMYSRSRREE